jgi:hypothetical protein
VDDHDFDFEGRVREWNPDHEGDPLVEGPDGKLVRTGQLLPPKEGAEEEQGGKTAPALPSSEDKARTKGLSHLSHPTPSRSKPGGTVG